MQGGCVTPTGRGSPAAAPRRASWRRRRSPAAVREIRSAIAQEQRQGQTQGQGQRQGQAQRQQIEEAPASAPVPAQHQQQGQGQNEGQEQGQVFRKREVFNGHETL